MQKTKVLKYIGFALLLLAVFFVYYIVEPNGKVWMPKCLFRLLTGLQCPSCGSQRALHYLLHGELLQAFWQNPFLIVSLPYVLAVTYVSFVKPKKSWLRWTVHPIVIWCYLGLLVGWWVVRNL